LRIKSSASAGDGQNSIIKNPDFLAQDFTRYIHFQFLNAVLSKPEVNYYLSKFIGRNEGGVTAVTDIRTDE
jgi:hypothetical protein